VTQLGDSVDSRPISDREFNAMLRGPLDHPSFALRLGRLCGALRVVVDAGGAGAREALRQHCQARTAADNDSGLT
jgi:hypothetical protein